MPVKIVIVDDAPFIREVLRHVLQTPDFQVVGEAEDGDEAVQLVDKVHPDVILMDIVMPKKSGIDAAREILAKQPHIKVIACSTLDQEAIVMRALEAGCFSYVTKPFKREDVIAAVRSAAQHQSMREEHDV